MENITWVDILDEILKDNASPKKFVYDKLKINFLELDSIPALRFYELLDTLKPHYFLEDKKQVRDLIKILVSKVEVKNKLATQIVLSEKPTAICYCVLANLLEYTGGELMDSHLDIMQWKFVEVYRNKALISAGHAMYQYFPAFIENHNYRPLCKKLLFNLAEELSVGSTYYYNVKTYFIPLVAKLTFGFEILREELVSLELNCEEIKTSLLYEILKEEAKRDSSYIPRQFTGLLYTDYRIMFEIVSHVSSKKYEYNHTQILFIINFLMENDLDYLKLHLKYFVSHLCVQVFFKKIGIKYIAFIKERIMDPIRRSNSKINIRTALFVYKTFMECLNSSLHTKYSLQGNEKNAGNIVRNKLHKYGIIFGKEHDIKLMSWLITTKYSDDFLNLLFYVDYAVVSDLYIKEIYYCCIHESSDIFIDSDADRVIRFILMKTCRSGNEKVLFLNTLAECCIPHIEEYLEDYDGIDKGPIACIKAITTAISTVGHLNLYPNHLERIMKIIDVGIPRLTSYLNDQVDRLQDLLKVCEKVTNQIAELMLVVMSQGKLVEETHMKRLFNYGEQLLSCNMRFIVAKCSDYFTKMVLFAGKYNYPFLRDYYQFKLITMETFVDSSRNRLRRSAELRTIMASIAKGLPRGLRMEFFEDAISCFMYIPKSLHEDMVVTKLNCLDEFFKESSFKSYVSKYVPQALVLSIYAANSEKYKIRNSGALLYATLINKLAPNQNIQYNINISGLVTLSSSFRMLMEKLHTDPHIDFRNYKHYLFSLLEYLNQDYYTPDVLFKNLLSINKCRREKTYWFNLFSETFIREKYYELSPIEICKLGLFSNIELFNKVFGALEILIKWYETRGLDITVHENWRYYLKKFEVINDTLSRDQKYNMREVINEGSPRLFELVLKNMLDDIDINFFTKLYALEQILNEANLDRKDFFISFFHTSCTFILESKPDLTQTLSRYIINGFRKHQWQIDTANLSYIIEPCWMKIQKSSSYAALISVIHHHLDNYDYFKGVPREMILKQFYSPNNELISIAFYSLQNFDPIEFLLCAIYDVCFTKHDEYPTILPNILDAMSLSANPSFEEFLEEIFSTKYFVNYFNYRNIDALQFFPIFEDRLSMFVSKHLVIQKQCSFLKRNYTSNKQRLVKFLLSNKE